MANVTPGKSNTGSGHTNAATTVQPGDSAVSSTGASHAVTGSKAPKRIFELPAGDLRCDN